MILDVFSMKRRLVQEVTTIDNGRIADFILMNMIWIRYCDSIGKQIEKSVLYLCNLVL